MTLPPLPPPTVPMLINGAINPVWYQYLAALDRYIRSLTP